MLSVNKINKKLLFILFLTVFLFLGFNLNIDAASAAETTSTTFNITVPYALPVSVAADGTVTTANNLEIKNAGTNAVKISEVKVEAQNGWELSDYGKDYSKTAVGRKEFGISIRGTSAAADGNIDTAKFQDILSENKALAITYDVTLPAQSEKISDTIANVVFVVEEIYEFDIDDNGAITGFSEYGLELYNGGKTEFVIPDTIKGITVTSIIDGNKYGTNTSGGAFSQKKNIIKITLPETIVRIGHKAFAACSSLKEINFPNSLSSIGNHAFDGCSGLEGVLTLPDNVTSIEDSAFYNCGIKNISFPEGLEEIERLAFKHCRNLESVDLSNTKIQYLRMNTFEGCTNLLEVKLPESITRIYRLQTDLQQDPFYNCENLKDIYCDWYKGDKTDIEANAPWGASNATVHYKERVLFNIDSNGAITGFSDYGQSLYDAGQTEFTIPDTINGITVNAIGTSAFSSKTKMTSITMPDNITSIGDFAFRRCSGLTGELKLPTKLKTIGQAAFSDCIGITGTLILPEGLTNIYSTPADVNGGAFANCTGITNVYFPSTLTIIPEYAFRYCSGITNITLSEGVTNIEHEAFFRCSNLSTLNLPSTLRTIGSSAFYECKKITGSLVIPEGVTTINNSAFKNCSGFTGELKLPNNITTIGSGAFAGCSGFTGELKLPNNITTIGSGAFNNCSGFTGKLIIPNSITEIESNTFRYCKKISGVIFPDGLTNISEWAFANCDALTGDIVIPSSVISVGNCAFYWDSNLQSVDLSTTNIESIESSTFFKCAKLISVKLPDTVKTIGNSAFENAGLVGELHLPNNLISIGRNAFNGCTGLTGSLIIPDGVTSIGNNAFMGCTKLTSATLPKEFTEIVSEGGTAFGLFYNDTKITDIYCNWYQGEKANIEAEAPWGATKATVHYLNNAAEAILEDELVLDELVPDEVISDAFTATDSAIENEVDNIVDIVDEDTPLSGMPDIVADVTKTPAVSVDESENNKDILTDITDGEANTVDKETTIIETSDNLKGENNNDQNSEKDDNTDNMLPDMIIKNGESEENREE